MNDNELRVFGELVQFRFNCSQNNPKTTREKRPNLAKRHIRISLGGMKEVQRQHTRKKSAHSAKVTETFRRASIG